MSESTPVSHRTTRTPRRRASSSVAFLDNALASTARKSMLYNPLAARISQQMMETSGVHRLTEALTHPYRGWTDRFIKATLPKPFVPRIPSFTDPVSRLFTPAAPNVPALKAPVYLRHTDLFTTITPPWHDALRPWLSVHTPGWNLYRWDALSHLSQLLQPSHSMMENLLGDLLRSLRYWGRRCYLAACAAGEAIHRGDLEPIKAFIEDELSLRPTEDRVQALATALLTDDWDLDLDIDDDALVKGFLRSQARKGTTLLGDHTVRGRAIAYMPDAKGLDLRPAPVPGPDQQVLSRLEPWDDPRLYLVMERLTGPERDVARAWSQDDRTSWSQAAVLCGHAPEFGERVRRKLKREGRVITHRTMERSSSK